MSTEIESTIEQSEPTTPADPHAAMAATLKAMGMEFDPHLFHGTAVDGEAKPKGSASGCPYAQFFSGLFGSEKG